MGGGGGVIKFAYGTRSRKITTHPRVVTLPSLAWGGKCVCVGGGGGGELQTGQGK